MSVNIGTRSIVKDGLVLHLDPASPKNYTLSEVEVLVVGGGGGGSFNVYDDGAGGGGGGVLYSSSYRVTPGSAITVTVGNGGAAGNSQGNRGQNSIFGNLIAQGGGGGQGHRSSTHAGANGGSGGGSGGQYSNDTNAPGEGTVGQGHRGGHSSSYGGGGGGGAGSPGIGCLSWQVGGIGGDGLPFDISGKLRYYGGGGGGYPKTNYNGLGGKGGGGDTYVAGTPNTGGGGGGGKAGSPSLPEGKAGGSGIVIVRYPGPQKATGGNTIENVNGYTIHTFTASGTFTPLNIPANAGTVYGLQDLSENSNTILQSNNPTYNTSNSGVINFDGTDDFLTLTNTLVNPGDFTYCAWIYRSAVSPNGYTNVFTSTLQNEQLQIDLTGYQGGFGMYVNGSYNSTTSNLIPLNTWVYVCWQRNGTGLYGYLNGVEQFNPSNGNNFGYTSISTAVSRVNKIGAYSSGTSYNLNGRLGPVQFYYKALTLNEIQQNFNALRGRFGV